MLSAASQMSNSPSKIIPAVVFPLRSLGRPLRSSLGGNWICWRVGAAAHAGMSTSDSKAFALLTSRFGAARKGHTSTDIHGTEPARRDE